MIGANPTVRTRSRALREHQDPTRLYAYWYGNFNLPQGKKSLTRRYRALLRFPSESNPPLSSRIKAGAAYVFRSLLFAELSA
jgi:hypothetical protein